VRIESGDTAPVDWDAFVAAHPATSAYHHAAAVSIGRDAFGLRCTFLSARDAQGALVGVLPLVEQSSFAFGRYLTSVPFFTYGGVLANDDAIAVELAKHAGELGKERRAAHVELRHTAPIQGLDFADRQDKVSMVLPLPATVEALSKQIGSKLRSQIKRAERENPQVRWGGAELLDDFYSVFSASMRDLGTPVYPRKFFDVVQRAFGGSSDVLTISVDGTAHAAAIIVKHGNRIEVPWAACSPQGKPMALNMRMYWEMLKLSVERGAQAFDFGRSSPDSGTYKFKAQWGAQPWQLHWHYWLPAGAPVPKLNNSNPKFQLATRMWSRLPLWCANAIGPLISRSLP